VKDQGADIVIANRKLVRIQKPDNIELLCATLGGIEIEIMIIGAVCELNMKGSSIVRDFS